MVNYLSNITPQNSSLNRTSWKYLEEKERELVNNNKYNKLYILAGTYNITNQEICQLPRSNNNSKVPHGFFKIIASI